MSNLPGDITEAELARFARLNSGIAQLTKERNELADRIKAAYDAAGAPAKRTYVYETAVDGTLVVTLGTQNRLRATAKDELMRAYPLSGTPEFWSMQIDMGLIPGDILDDYREPTRTLKVEPAAKEGV